MAYGQIRSSSGRELNLTPAGWINNEGVNLNDAPLNGNALMSALGQAQPAPMQPQAPQPPGMNRLAQVASAPSLSDFLDANGTSMQNLVDYNGKKAFRVADGYVWQNPDGSTGKATIRNPQQDAFDAQQRAVEKDRLAMDATRANTERTKLETEQLMTPTKASWEIQQTDNGLVRVNKATGQAEPVSVGGKPITGTGKAPTEFQGKAATFGARADNADRIINDLGTDYSPAAINVKHGLSKVWGVGGALEAGANMMLGQSSQKAEQAQRDFVNALLRQESGAVIGVDEFDSAKKQYFPQPGDGKDVLAQKARNRKLSIQGLMNNAGKAAFHAPAEQAGDIHAQADAILNGGR